MAWPAEQYATRLLARLPKQGRAPKGMTSVHPTTNSLFNKNALHFLNPG